MPIGLRSLDFEPQNSSESEDSTTKKVNQEQRRREEIAAMAREERKKRIARQLEQASQKAQETEEPKSQEEPRREVNRPPKGMFSKIAGEMLKDRQEARAPVREEAMAELELAIREINRVVNASKLSREQRIEVIVDHLRGRKKAGESLKLILQNIEAGNSNIPRDIANEALGSIIKQNQEAYKTVLETLEDDEKEEVETKLNEKPKKDIEPQPELEVDALAVQRSKRAERVATYRKITQIDNRIKELEQKGNLTAEERDELLQLQEKRQELLLDQLDNIQESKIVDYKGEELDSTVASYLLDKDKLQSLLESGESLAEMLPSEKEKFDQIINLIENPAVRGAIEDLNNAASEQEKKTILASNQELNILLDQISNPLIAGRIELSLKRKEDKLSLHQAEGVETDYTKLDELAEEFADYEIWKREGPVQERIAAAREDFMTKILLLNLEDFDETDLYLTLEQFNLGSIKVDRNGKITTEINKNLDKSDQHSVDTLIKTARMIREQHQTAWEIVGYDRDQDDEQKAKQTEFVEAVQADIVNIFNEIHKDKTDEADETQRLAQSTKDSTPQLESSDFLKKLYSRGIVSLEITPTGVSMVVNSYLVGEDYEAAYTQLLKAIGAGEQIDNINNEGIGLTINEQYLHTLKDKLEGQALPSVSIIVLPEDPTKRHIGASIQRHETTDYLLETFDSAEINQLRKDNNLEQIPEAMNRGLRELSSRISDGSIGIDNKKFFLDDLYIAKSDKMTQQEQDAMVKLVRTIEGVLAQTPSEFGDGAEVLQDQIRRSQLAFNLRSKLREYSSQSSEGLDISSTSRLLEQIIEDFQKEYNISIKTDGETLFSDNEKSIARNKAFHQFYSYRAHGGRPTPAPISYIGISDTSGPQNKALKEAQGTAQFGGSMAPDWYGPPGEGAQNTTWEFSDEGFGFIPPSVLPGFRTLAKIPLVGNILDAPIVPVPKLKSYAIKRTYAAKLARSFDPRLRKLARETVAHEDLGANPTKALFLISPELEHKVKKFAPGWLAAHKVSEGRENLPVSMELGMYDQLYQQGPQWLAQLGIGDGLIGSVDMQRYLGELMGVKYEFNGQTYQFAVDHQGLRKVTEVEAPGIRRVQSTATKLMTRTPSGEYRYKYNGPRYNPSAGVLSSFLKEGLGRMGTGETQAKVAKFFKKNARRSDLPSDTKNIFEWERQIGSEYREYWKERDGIVALETLKDESDYFLNRDPGQPENYSLYELSNLVHYGEEQLKQDSWQTNETGKNVKLTINNRGRTETVVIRPGEYLRDPYGNLIPPGVELQKSGGELIVSGGALQADLSDDLTHALWGRLVGDYQNPHLRFIRLNSIDGMEKAIDKFGTDEDDGYDPNNVILRTDGIKWAIHQANLGIMSENLVNGLAPDRRYEMKMIKSSVGPEFKPVIDFEGTFTNRTTGVTHNSFNLIGTSPSPEDTATDELIDYIHEQAGELSDPLKHYVQTYLSRKLPTGHTYTRAQVSEAMEQVLRATGDNGGKNLSSSDIFFEDIIKLKTYDASWYHPYRQEQNAILPMDEPQAKFIMDTLDGGFNKSKERFERAQDFLYQWQKAVVKIHQYERIAYTAIAHYKGLAKVVERATNLGMLASFLAMGLTGNPLAFYNLLLSFGARYEFKPWATKQSKQWTAKRIKALQRIQEVESIDNIFAKAIEKGIPTEYELGRMMSKTEEIIFWMEDLAKTEAPDDWFPNDDKVLSTWSSLIESTKERLKQL